MPAKILGLTQDLKKPEAQDPETKLRILTIGGMLETNYDAGQARATWGDVKKLALKRGHLELASRAEGEQGIAAFILGDTDTAKKQVVKAWVLSKVDATQRRLSAMSLIFELACSYLGLAQNRIDFPER